MGRWGDGEMGSQITIYPFLLACLLLACLLPLNCSEVPAPCSLKPRKKVPQPMENCYKKLYYQFLSYRFFIGSKPYQYRCAILDK
ncbi:MAG: hypothetical protein F6K55_23630 [Moorea sp. SIO4A3]|nr:hypothetical protein [Moorena sp. SIO4A3]